VLKFRRREIMKDVPKGDIKEKKPYTKPEVKQVLLKPEEAVLGGCKVSGTAGPGQPGDYGCVTPPSSPCSVNTVS
jgi:hypothetical protein